MGGWERGGVWGGSACGTAPPAGEGSLQGAPGPYPRLTPLAIHNGQLINPVLEMQASP